MAFFIFVYHKPMKLYLTTLFFLISLTSFNQSGYLGSKYNITLQCNSVPLIFGFKGKLVKNKTAFQYGNRNLNLSYLIGINRVIHDQLQVGISYKFTPIQFFGDYSSNYGFIHHKINHQSILFNFRKVKQGISPIGRQWGLNFEIGRSNMTEFKYSIVEFESDPKLVGLTNLRWDINPDATETDVVISSTPRTINTFIIKYFYGRTFPIHKKLALDYSLTVSLLRVFKTPFKTFTGFQLFNDDFDYNELGIEILDEAGVNTYYSDEFPLAFSILKHNDFSLNIGLRYFL